MAVIKATDNDFNEVLGSNPKVVVKYYADWCGNCRLFSPKFKRLSDDEQFTDVAFVDVNAENSPEARKKAGVTNLPFFAVFKNGELVDTLAASKEDAVRSLIQKLEA
ncbi:thioredoxin family protein [Pontibacter sp. CAU 1760]